MSATIDNLTWFVGGWLCATVFFIGYVVWSTHGGTEQRLYRKLRAAQRELKTAQADLAECERDRLRCIAEHDREMEYRNRDRRQLAEAVEKLRDIYRMCEDVDTDLTRSIQLTIVGGE